ncbi:MAG: response regulator [Burkholderiales bacterium]
MTEPPFHHPALRVLLESEETAVFVRAGEVEICNAATCRLLGVESEALTGRSTFDFSPPIQPDGTTSSEGVRQRMQSALAGLPQWFQWQFRRGDGELVATLVHLEAVRFDGHICLVARVRNVSHLWNEEILREAALAVSAAEGPDLFDQLVRSLATILKADVASIAVFADDSGERLRTVALFRDGRILPNVDYQMAGTPCADVVGREFRYYPAQARSRFPADSMMAGLGVESYAGYPLNDAAGTPLGNVAVMSRSPLASGELTESMLKIFALRAAAEIERGRADAALLEREAQLRQAQKMEAIGHLAGGIAHDFNNILTSIMGYIALADERDATAGDDKLAKYLHQANLSCQRARELIQQILTFSRGRRSERQPTSLPRVVGESTNLLRSSLPATLELVTDLDADAPPAMLDPVQAEQVLLNLCINARDAMGGSGTVRVAVRRVALDGAVCASCRQRVQGEFVELGVRDDGPGITPAVMERMFEPFFTTKEVGKGSGMGLSTVHGIVHEHGGHVLVESETGCGAVFRVLFAALDRGRAAVGADAAGAVSRAGKAPSLRGQVLVVDDEAMVGEFMRDLLESWGLRVTVAANGAQARDLCSREPRRFDAVITDQTMPRITGLDLARELLVASPDLPVILYTGYSDGLTEAEVKAAGAVALVRKPVEPRALRALLEAALVARGRSKE